MHCCLPARRLFAFHPSVDHPQTRGRTMKNLVRVVAMGFAVAASASVAQAQTGVRLGLGGGAAVPTGTLADGAKTGWSSEVVARVKPAASPVALQVDGFYNRFALEGGIDGNARMLGGTANAV